MQTDGHTQCNTDLNSATEPGLVIGMCCKRMIAKSFQRAAVAGLTGLGPYDEEQAAAAGAVSMHAVTIASTVITIFTFLLSSQL